MVADKDDIQETPLGVKWMRRIEREKKAHKSWREQAKVAEDAYREEDENTDKPRSLFPIWWSTVQITHAAIFASSPKPDVRKRYNDQSSTEDTLAQAIERVLSYVLDTTYFEDNGHLAVDDYLVGGCGQCKIELKTEVGEGPILDPMTQQPIMGADGKPLLQKVVTHQTLKLRHFHWSKFAWEPGKDWDSCGWVSFIHDMTRDEIAEQFKIDADSITNASDSGTNKNPDKKYSETLEVHEIWDKKRKKQVFIVGGRDEALEENEDPLKLQGFFPCPKPMMTNIKATALIPKPDYFFIKKQCENISRLTGRIMSLTGQIKDVGFYDQQLSELGGLENAIDGTLIPIKNLMERLAKNNGAGFDSVVAKQDNVGKVNVLRELISQRDIEKNNVFETVGISDIVRGASQASETAAAQTIKAQWANVRIGPKIKCLAMFFRESFRIMSEVAAEHFTPEQLNRMAGMELGPEELKALKDDLSRQYAIDVETDSTLAADDAEERGQRLEMLQTMTGYLQTLLPLAQQNLMPADMVKQTLLFALRSFKYGRQLEDAIQKLPDNVAQLQQLQQSLQQCQQQLQQTQGQVQQMQQELGKVSQQDQAIAQADMQNQSVKTQADAQDKQASANLKQAQTMKTTREAMLPPQFS